MASIPAGGYPSFSSVSQGLGKGKPEASVMWFGLDELEDAILKPLTQMPKAMHAALTELGLFGEKETKERTPVEYGVLRASIGHFDPGSVHGVPDEPADPGNAVFEVDTDGKEMSVTWGTNVEYAPWIEWGFTMSPGRVVYIRNVGFRYVAPFTYRGAHMFELGLQATVKAAEPILTHWAHEALTAGGLS